MTAPPLPSLRALTSELRALHAAWSHPDAGGGTVGLVYAGTEVGWVLECTPHPDLIGAEDILGTIERGCEACDGAGRIEGPYGWTDCHVCDCQGRVHVSSTFDPVGAARRLLAAVRDAGYR